MARPATSKRTSKIAAILPDLLQGVVIATPEAAPEVEKPAPRGQGIGALVKELITQGLNNDAVLAQVKEQFPTASTNKACVSWYRSNMKKKGELPA